VTPDIERASFAATSWNVEVAPAASSGTITHATPSLTWTGSVFPPPDSEYAPFEAPGNGKDTGVFRRAMAPAEIVTFASLDMFGD
jgi:hypothetical protein